MNFIDNEKRRQAAFRKKYISQQGRSPTDEPGQRHDYMIALCYEHENLYHSIQGDNGARKFFSQRDIKWWRQRKYDQGINRPTRNMASSQIMCVNFLLPLADIPEALTAVVHEIDKDVERVVDICHADRTSLVEFEWIGIPKSLEMRTTRGWKSTSIDAFIIAETSAGQRRAYLLEWKYTESSTGKPEGEDRGPKQLQTYSDLYYADSSSFNGNTPMKDLFYDPIDQMMRSRLLADRMMANEELNVSDARVIVVAPNENEAYRITPRRLAKTERFPDLNTVSEVFSATLKDPDRAFATVSPTLLLDAVERECGGDEKVSDWSKYMRERYGL